MSREWKPGDVAVDTNWGYRSIFIASCHITEHGRNGDPCWHNESGMSDRATAPRRPLVVIDAEDREQVERLTDALDRLITSGDDYADGVRAALREFANPTPPKPEEPTGLGAVVEDEDGVLWIRADGDKLPWLNSESSRDYWLSYADVAVVRVLSEGVQS